MTHHSTQMNFLKELCFEQMIPAPITSCSSYLHPLHQLILFWILFGILRKDQSINISMDSSNLFLFYSILNDYSTLYNLYDMTFKFEFIFFLFYCLLSLLYFLQMNRKLQSITKYNIFLNGSSQKMDYLLIYFTLLLSEKEGKFLIFPLSLNEI